MNPCYEIYLPATYSECMLGNYGPDKNICGQNINADCIYALDIGSLTNGPRHATDEMLWAIEMFGLDNIDFMRTGSALYFKYEADLMMFALKWL